MIDIDVFVKARPDVQPLTSAERDLLARELFDVPHVQSGSRSRGLRDGGIRHGRRNIAAVAAAGVIVVGGFVVIGSLRSDQEPQPRSDTSPVDTTPSSQLPPVTDATTVGRTLTDGAAGEDVVALQQRLNDLGFDPGPINGTFGIETTHAVWAFERLVMGTQPDQVTGQVTPDMWAAMTNTDPITPRRPGPVGVRHVEVYLSEQTLVAFDGERAELVAPISSGAVDSSGAPATFCQDVTTDVGQSGEPVTEPTELHVCGEAYTPGGAFNVMRILDGTHTNELGVMTDPIFFNYGIAIYGTLDLPTVRSTHGGIATSEHLATEIAAIVGLDSDVFVWDGIHEPEDQTDVDRLPRFLRPDPDFRPDATSIALPCSPANADGDISHSTLSNLSAEVATLDDGSVGIVVTDSQTGQQQVGGCMPAATAAHSLTEGLSLAYVTPVADGVFVAVAIPEGRELAMPDDVVRGRSTPSPTPTGFELLVLDADRVAALKDLDLSAAQLQNLITNATTNSTIATAGLGPDILDAD